LNDSIIVSSFALTAATGLWLAGAAKTVHGFFGSNNTGSISVLFQVCGQF